MLQHTAAQCNTLQYTATHCNTLQHTATHCNTGQDERRQTMLQHTAAHCNTMQHTATHCNTLQHPAPPCTTLQHRSRRKVAENVAPHCNTLQHTATHCSTLHHTASHCITLQHATTRYNTGQDEQWQRMQHVLAESCAPGPRVHRFEKVALDDQRISAYRPSIVEHSSWPQRYSNLLTHIEASRSSVTCMTNMCNVCVAVCCSVLQCVAVCCSVLQCYMYYKYV